MNDRLKYRVWDSERKIYINPRQCLLDGNGNFFYVDAANGQLYNWTEDFVVEPCSPKKDINNKSLYAGDIVIWNDGGGEPELNPEKGWIRKAVVSFDPELCFILTNDTPSGTPGHKFRFSNFMYSDTENHLKKIGTVHEKNNRDTKKKSESWIIEGVKYFKKESVTYGRLSEIQRFNKDACSVPGRDGDNDGENRK